MRLCSTPVMLGHGGSSQGKAQPWRCYTVCCAAVATLICVLWQALPPAHVGNSCLFVAQLLTRA
jgi:hypothetical protein